MSGLSPKLETVIFLNDYCYVNGGASRVAIEEAVGLSEKGVNVIFLGSVGPVCDELATANVITYCLNQQELLNHHNNPLVAFQGLWNLKAARIMRTILAQCDMEHTLVHLHGYTKALTTSPLRVAYNKGFKVICTLHDFFAACPNGALFDYVKRKPCELKGMSVACIKTNCDKRHYAHKLFRVLRSFLQKHLGRLPKGITHYISLSHQSELLLKPYFTASSIFYPLDNMTDVVQQPHVTVQHNHTIVVVGRLDVEKGIETVLHAAEQLGVTITFIGDGPLRTQAEQQGHRVTGWISIHDVWTLLESARYLIFPSLWYETYGLVVTEAAARGIPSIVSTISAASERVIDQVTGWHMEAGNSDDLMRCMQLAQQDALVAQTGLNAYQDYWNEPNTRARHIEALLTIYQRMMAS